MILNALMFKKIEMRRLKKEKREKRKEKRIKGNSLNHS